MEQKSNIEQNTQDPVDSELTNTDQPAPFDIGPGEHAKLDIPKQSIQSNVSAMKRFCNMDRRATTEDCTTALETLHQKSITQVSTYEVDKQDCRKLCTTGNDGAMTIWDFKTLESSIRSL